MVRCVLVILLGMVALLPCLTRTPMHADDSRFVSISLPPNVPSETVQISYYLVGPFGGYGSYVVQQVGVSSYQIPAMVDGKAATEIRVIVYASGCEIQKFVIPLTENLRVSREFPCQRVETVKLSGQIVPNELSGRPASRAGRAGNRGRSAWRPEGHPARRPRPAGPTWRTGAAP